MANPPSLRAPRKAAKCHPSWHGSTGLRAGGGFFCSVLHLLDSPVPASASVLTQTRARGLAKQNPNLLTPHPSRSLLCCCCCCFINGFSASLMSCVCLPCPAGTRDPATSISDFSGEPRAGFSLGQRSLEQPLPAPSALTRPRALRCRCACPRARHRPDPPRCPGEPGTWGLLQRRSPPPPSPCLSFPTCHSRGEDAQHLLVLLLLSCRRTGRGQRNPKPRS